MRENLPKTRATHNRFLGLRDHQGIKQAIRTFLCENEIYLFVFVLFMPDYWMYPFLGVYLGFTMFFFVTNKGIRWTFFWPFWIYIMVVAALARNALGLTAGLFLLCVKALHFRISLKMTVLSHLKMQQAIVWASIINYFFNFITIKPFWYSALISFLGRFIEFGELNPYGVHYPRAYSTFDNPNLYAFVLMLVLLVCANMIRRQVRERNISLIVFYSASFILNISALVMSGTRAIWPALFIGIIAVVVLQQQWMQLKVIALLGSVGALFIALNPELFPRFFEIVDHSDIRMGIWETAIAQFQSEPWFGKGLYTYALMFDYSHAHNIFIESLICFGIIGSLLCALFFIEVLIGFIKQGSWFDHSLALSTISAALVFGIFDIPLLSIQPLLLFIVLMCIPSRPLSDLDAIA